jgi:hypothetical protein
MMSPTNLGFCILPKSKLHLLPALTIASRSGPSLQDVAGRTAALVLGVPRGAGA